MIRKDPEERGKVLIHSSIVDHIVTFIVLTTGVSWLMTGLSWVHWLFTIIMLLMAVALGKNPKNTVLGMCVVEDEKGKRHFDLSKWDKKRADFDPKRRLSNLVSLSLFLVGFGMVGLWVWRGFIYLAAFKITTVVIYEVAAIRIYRYLADDSNKRKWGAAAYLYEVREFFKGCTADDADLVEGGGLEL